MAPLSIYFSASHITDSRLTALYLPNMHDNSSSRSAHISNLYLPSRFDRADDPARVGDLSTRFNIEASFEQHRFYLLTFYSSIHHLPLAHQGKERNLHLGLRIRIIRHAIRAKLSLGLQVAD